ncbi:MAG: TonB family protein [Phycisphaera sp.]|nr:TonB family protein [Phycisphaera sp.]
MTTRRKASFLKTALIRSLAAAAGLALSVGLFLLLPFLERITSDRDLDLMVQAVNTAQVPPPPPPIEEEEEEPEPEPEEPEPPKLAEEAPPLDLAQLELALNPGMGGGGAGDFAVTLPVGGGASEEDGGVDALFSLSDLDQKPRIIYDVQPQFPPALKKLAPATVYIVFIVDQRGRVENPMVQSSTDSSFDAPALAAVRQWRFEPGKRNGEPVRFRMRVPITFPKPG